MTTSTPSPDQFPLHTVDVEVATVWTSPDAPRPVDTPALADVPDLQSWTRQLSSEYRLGLHGRTLTQLVRDEPALLLEERGDWARVAAPWQPAPMDSRGYPGWVRRAHLSSTATGEIGRPVPAIEPEPEVIAGYARQFLGLRYLWGGTSPWGLDCSGLVHSAYRRAGIVIPRDASAQHAAAIEIPLGRERPGDLYFFARSGAGVHHVGFVTDRWQLLHAPEDGGVIEDAPLTEARRGQLVAAGRFFDR